ncbi:MAG: N-acetylmuramoyl-L-alanine amidase [Rhodovulum sulfidophilum]|uniref:N-acetylmuramoyl-L-alanine amidase n=1 Tax=Rhodovulum sulfidophilum TaxID=35806 RepID=A0A2W5N9S6_RHOSU|nr:MAG: N-acetylmuramoyl-L-alanine amidase [Rhodovulum sulfidophilum]
MKRVILHWTAGTNVVSALDRQHYHRIVDGEGSVFAGVWPIEANERINPKGPVTYAAHTLNCNTGAIGVALAGMKGAVEAPFSAGLYPINELQLRAAAQLVAYLCRQYRIPVSPTTVLTHAEVQRTLGIAQRGKWDIARLPWRPDLVGARPVGDHIRALVSAEMTPAVYEPAPVAVTGGSDPEPVGFLALILAALRGLFGPKGA